MICEKPLATSVEQAEELVSLAAQQAMRNCVCDNLGFYPMVQQIHSLREVGKLGEILVVQGTYFAASQVSAGRKTRLNIEICGTKSSVAWNQERPDELWVGQREQGNRIVLRDPSLLDPGARPFADLPGGHSEGYDDSFKQIFRRSYPAVGAPDQAPEYPQFGDGLRQLHILNAALKSNRTRGWVDVPSPQSEK